jgi:hypothetical protein
MVTMPEIAMLAGTRVAAGAGLGLLLAERLERGQRRAIGWTLLAVGALSTIPLVAGLRHRRAETAPRFEDAAHEHAHLD